MPADATTATTATTATSSAAAAATKPPRASITADEVRAMRNRFRAKETTVAAEMARYRMSRGNIYFIVRGKTWAKVGGALKTQQLPLGDLTDAESQHRADKRRIVAAARSAKPPQQKRTAKPKRRRPRTSSPRAERATAALAAALTTPPTPAEVVAGAQLVAMNGAMPAHVRQLVAEHAELARWRAIEPLLRDALDAIDDARARG